jgi:hypothetical protein
MVLRIGNRGALHYEGTGGGVVRCAACCLQEEGGMREYLRRWAFCQPHRHHSLVMLCIFVTFSFYYAISLYEKKTARGISTVDV